MNSSENKNLVIAMLLMLAVWLGFSFFFPPAPKETILQVATDKAVSVATQTGQTSADNSDKVAEIIEKVVVEKADLVATETTAPARDIVVETEKYQAIFTTQGARLLSFKLKDYRATAAPDSLPVQMFSPATAEFATLRTTGTEGFALSEDAAFEISADDQVQVSAGEQFSLSFRHVAANGVQYVKTFNIHGSEYTIDTTVAVHNTASQPLRGTINLSLIQRWDDSMQADSYSFSGPASFVKDEIEEVKVDDLKEAPIAYGSGFAWTSFQTKYFLSVIVPGPRSTERIQILRRGETVENRLETPYFTLQPGEQRQLDYLAFIGPKDPQLLKAAGHQLDKVVTFGFFNILAQPLFLVLTFFYGFFKNYGVAIILLTVLIKLIFWPLTHKSYSSMKSMQKLQPEMQKLRDKYKSDKEGLNKEMMALYKTHRVNPLGGCLPMLVQIPVFFALYKVLLESIALRHAPFAFWLTDLSAKDPYYITPLLMGASMFVQQKMTPTTADPMQAKIFMMMPVVFTFMFLNFPSGLVIYWLVNNLLTILQQYFIHKKAA